MFQAISNLTGGTGIPKRELKGVLRSATLTDSTGIPKRELKAICLISPPNED